MSISGFYTGTITSFEGEVTTVLELNLGESKGEVGGYLTLYEPHMGSGDLEIGSYLERILKFSVFASFEGLPYVCEYVGEVFPDQERISGWYDCFHSEGSVMYESGEWFAFR